MIDLEAFKERYMKGELLPTDIPKLFAEIQQLRKYKRLVEADLRLLTEELHELRKDLGLTHETTKD